MKTIQYTLLFIFLCINMVGAQVGFQSHTIIDPGNINSPNSVFGLDVDNDGHPDLVSASENDNKIAWYKNNGTGNLGTQRIISINALAPSSASPADINGDGKMDILVVSRLDNTIVWFKNEGFGTFSTPRMVSTNLNSATSAIAQDIDGDGDLDVVITSEGDSKLVWVENINNQGTFGPEQVIYNNELFASKVAASDLDDDGDLDLISVVGNTNVQLVWFENVDGLGNYSSEHIIDANVQTYSLLNIYGFDIDGDGDTDILTNHATDQGLVYYENVNGIGSFSSAIPLNSDDVSQFRLTDLDQDGDTDVIAKVDNKKIAWYEHVNGQINFSNQQELINTEGFSNMNLADLSENGLPDVLISTSVLDKVAWYPSMAPGTYDTEMVISEGDVVQGSYCIQAADLDGDGYLDAISANSFNNTITWHKNNHDEGTFDEPRIVTLNDGLTQSVFIADLDGDSDLDIISPSSSDGNAAWFKNTDGQGTFVKQQPFATNFDIPISVTSDDLDADGDMDVIIFDFNRGMLWFENVDGLGNFGQAQPIDEEGSYCEFIHTVDIDGDGDKDVIAALYMENVFVWYENTDGQGTFGNQQIIDDTLSGNTDLYYADLDGDDDMDLIGTSGGENTVVWYENTDGLGTFGPATTISNTCLAPWQVKTMDADQDGDMDVFVTGYREDTVSWYENTDGLGTFGNQQLLDIDMNGAQALAVGDINNDGTPDLMASTYLGDQIRWYENLGVFNNNIDGTIRVDLDANGCTSNDNPMQHVLVRTEHETHSFATFTQPDGTYRLFTNPGTFTTSLGAALPPYYAANPTSHTSEFIGQNNNDTADFCVGPTETINDLNIAYYPINEARPGFEAEYQIVVNNTGTTIQEGTITLTFDDAHLDFLTASEPVSSQSGNTVTFSYAAFKPFETKSIFVHFQVATPPTTQLDDILHFEATIDPVSGDQTEADNSFALDQTVIGSYDPNDIQVLEGSYITPEETDAYLHYIIRFQNTGTAPAINVNVTNELDANLDWSTFQIEQISHDNRVEITDDNQVAFIFNNINLPDAATNEAGSHGFIQYKIKPKNNIQVGDYMQNDAAIYFDFNPPVRTNTVITTVENPLEIDEHQATKLVLYPVPTTDVVYIQSITPIVKVQLFN